MALSWNEIKDRALKFSNEWADETRERAEKDSFWNDFFNVFGISRRRVATFEAPVKKLSGHQGFIDLFWKGTLLVEHKSKDKDLEKAYTQATDYFPGLKEHELPKYILVSDFARLKLYNLDDATEHEFPVAELYKNVKLFGFIAGYQKRTFQEEDPVNIKAAELMGKLHDQLETFGYQGHHLEVYLVRLLFILFADDTSIFERNTFKEFVELKTNEDGSDLGALMAQFFQVLNTPKDTRLTNLDEHLNQFPYVNGKLFEEPLPIAAFNANMRSILLEASALDWGKISPAIFGSLFQSVMNPEERRNLGAHYTSEKNIFKLIKPLFLDELRAEFEKIKSNTKKLKEFHYKLSTLKFLDPACGSGNFLIITYRELRLLEIDILRELFKSQIATNIESILWLDVDQFYGIEYDEFASKIAEVAMWLIDHQMNMRVSEEFGQYFARLPLKKAAKIVHGNSLRIDWETVVAKNELSYIIGNPPFIGAAMKTKTQVEDMNMAFDENINHGKLDYVAAWYYLAAKFMMKTKIDTAFVSTNSISQGEQVSILWSQIINKMGLKINFAHRTFNWTNDAKGKAAVHCVIIGFSTINKEKRLYDYQDINGEPFEIKAKNINPYLVNGKNIFIEKTRNPICQTQKMIRGNIPYDDGNLLLSLDEKKNLLKNEPELKNYIKKYGGSYEMLNNKWRYCFWLLNVSPKIIRESPYLIERINRCKQFRENAKSKSVNSKSKTPYLFGDLRQPTSNYLLIPRVSSHKRNYLPIGYISKETILADSAYGLPDATKYQFGILQSLMHNNWIRTVAGKLKSDFRYSNNLVYNNYPWPKDPSDKNKKNVATKAQQVLDVRLEFPESSLADLYHPLTMPPKLVKAHQALDKAVDLCYRPQAFTNENTRIEFLFELYNQYTAPLLNSKKKT
ncbi:DNA methyltransferase [Hyunsoonleella sp. 2307UL5-6]|uniref:DNA methyltransferase n=1 Tax=Hyunsoonleella sp. 2307UL5-6 TaxID=3384768 RepID=UPI0039BD2AAD